MIARNYSAKPGEDAAREMAGVKRTLLDSRRATNVEFLCLRKERVKEAGSGGGSSGSKTTARA